MGLQWARTLFASPSARKARLAEYRYSGRSAQPAEYLSPCAGSQPVAE
jgi:hypothetical protein